MHKKIIITSIVSLILVFMNGCIDVEMQSSVKKGEINIDGQINDWDGNLAYLDDQGLALGFQNDNKYLYICATSRDRMKIRRLLGTGITIWLDPNDGKGKAVGIIYPVHAPGEFVVTRGMGNEDQSGPDRMQKLLENQREFLLVNKENYPLGYYSVNGAEGYKLKIGLDRDIMVYELRVPLIPIGSSQQACVSEDKTILISFESVEMKKPERGGHPGGVNDRPEDGMGPGGGMGGGRHSGMRDGKLGGMSDGMKEAMEPIDFSVSLKLGI